MSDENISAIANRILLVFFTNNAAATSSQEREKRENVKSAGEDVFYAKVTAMENVISLLTS
jgi:hypothetical protein